jgi:RNA polymerase subunit RPABC4/transcription elongation factor Spt4
MSSVDEHQQSFGRFCIGCGLLLLADQSCPNCNADAPSTAVEEESLQLSVNLSVLRCAACNRVNSIGTLTCPSCGERVDSSEITDPREGPLNRVKWDALGDLLPSFRGLATFPIEEQNPASLVTDDQFIRYVNRHSIFSPDLLVGSLKGLARQIDLSDEDAIRSPETRRGFEELLKSAQQLRQIYDELAGVRAPEQFSELHLQATVAFQTAIDLHMTCARAILALTVEELQAAQRELQASFDRLSVVGEVMVEEVENADPEAVGEHRIQRRLDTFVRRPGQYEHAGRPDLAAVLVAKLSEGRDFARLGQEGAAYFGRMLLIDPSTLPPEQGLVLYVLAAQVAASDDPLTLRRWSNVLLDVLNEAFRKNPAAMEAAVSAADVDIEEAMVHLLSVGDTLRNLQIDELPIEAVRQQLTSSYQTLVEWSHRRLLNLLLAAKFVLRGKPKPYEQIAVADSATKRDWLSKTVDPRYAPAFLHLSATIRNAGAHGDVETSGSKIRFITRNKNRTKVLGVEELTEDEFAGRLRDLLLTCDALRLSAELFRIEHLHDLPSPVLPTRARVMDEIANIIIGYFGLVHARTRRQEEELVAVDAEVAEGMSAKAPRDYLAVAFTVATLFPTHTKAELRVLQKGELKCRIQAPIAEVVTQQALPEDVRNYYLLKTCYLSAVEPSDDGNVHDRYMRQLIRAGSRLLMQDVAAAQQLRAGLPRTKQDYAVSLKLLIQKANVLADVLRAVEPPETAAPPRDSLLLGLESLRRGLTEHQRLMRSGRWAAVGRRSDHLERGARIVVRWSK